MKKLLLISILSIALIGCQTLEQNTLPEPVTPAQQARDTAGSLTTLALNTTWFISHGNEAEWAKIVKTIRNDVYPSLVLANSGSMLAPAAFDMIQGKLQAYPKLIGFTATLQSIAGNSGPALDGITKAMADWLRNNP